MVGAAAVDLFLTYIAGRLGSIFTVRRETLRSGAQLRLDAILNHASMADLVKDLADQQVNELAFKGFVEFHGAVQQQVGLVLLPDKGQFGAAILAIECRNLLVHNHGMVNRIFKARVPNSKAALGERVSIPASDVVTELPHWVLDIDARACNKFGLPAATTPPAPRMCKAIGA